ncbi:DMT family transporter [Paractinoplanes rishiriensis]|uniref:DMT family transporter n=1 Tax=Paractinoplanes rishiriensis TaxID=1050105 RepID=UPI003F68DC26
MTLLPALAGAAGMVFVGGSVAVSGALADAPMFTVQAARYAVACLLLVLFVRLTGRRLVRPRGTDWLWLVGVVLTGMLLFNVALVLGSRHAEPAVLGVAVACVPVLLAVAGPLLEGHGPAPRLVAAAVVVTGGAALVQGFGRADLTGLLWAVVTFACEAGFTLLAVPVLGRHGAFGVSVHACWLAAVVFAVTGLVWEGPGALGRLGADDVLAGAYLAVAVTAVAFVLWYSCVERIGSARAGLLTGVAPIAAAVAGVALGGPVPGVMVWLGVAVVAAGLALGFRAAPSGRAPASSSPPSRTGRASPDRAGISRCPGQDRADVPPPVSSGRGSMSRR